MPDYLSEYGDHATAGEELALGLHEDNGAAQDMLDALPDMPAEIHNLPSDGAPIAEGPYPVVMGEIEATGNKKRVLSRYGLIGVDISPRYIRLSCLKGKKIRYAEKTLPDAMTWEELAEHKGAAVQAVKDCLRELKPGHNLAAVALPLSASALGRVSLQNMTGEALKDLIAADHDFWRNALAKDVDLEHYALYHEVVSRNPEHDTMEMIISGYKRDAAAFFENIAIEAGLRPASLDFRETAMLRIAAHMNESDGAPAAILQIGPEENHVLIVHDGLPVHKEIVISDWDRMALTGGDEQMLDGVAARYAEEFRAASAELYAKGAHPPSRVLVASYVPLSPVFVERLRQSLPEAALYAAARHEKSGGWLIKPLAETPENAPFSPEAAAVCLAARFPAHKGVKTCRDVYALNLLPKAKETGEAVYARTLGFTAATGLALLVLAGAATGSLIVQGQKMRVGSDLDEAKRLSAAYEQKLARAKELTGITGQLREIRSLPDALPLNQAKLAAALKDIHESIPAGVWLENFNYKFPHDIELRGNAFYDADILAFMNALSQKNGFAGIALKMMEAKEQKRGGESKKDNAAEARPVKQFRINATFQSE